MIDRLEQLDGSNARFKLVGFSDNAAVSSTTDISKKFAEARWISGGQFIVKNGLSGDSASFRIVDIDNVLGYGANTEIYEFAETIIIQTDTEKQIELEMQYIYLMPAGVYVQIRYTNSSNSNVPKVGMNLMTHIQL